MNVSREEEIMSQAMRFGEVLEAADRLLPDEQHELIASLNRRLAQAGRERIAAEVREERREFASGECAPTKAEELMGEIMG